LLFFIPKFIINFSNCTQKIFIFLQTIEPVDEYMSNYENIVLNFKVGTLKELHRRNLITREEMEKTLKMIKA